MRHVCFGDDGRNTVKGQARCRVIAQQMSAYNLLQYGQCQRQHRQQFGGYGSARLEVYHPVLLTILTTAHPNQGGEVFAVTIVKRFRPLRHLSSARRSLCRRTGDNTGKEQAHFAIDVDIVGLHDAFLWEHALFLRHREVSCGT